MVRRDWGWILLMGFGLGLTFYAKHQLSKNDELKAEARFLLRQDRNAGYLKHGSRLGKLARELGCSSVEQLEECLS